MLAKIYKTFMIALAIGSFSLLTSVTLAKNKFDHSYKAWDKILKNNVTINEHYNRFNYKNIKSNLSQLKAYTQTLSNVSMKQYQGFSRNQKLAFLINSYNAFTVQVIAENYPIKSILKLGVFGSGPWGKKNIPFLGTKFSLNMIEKDYMIPKFKEARIHFAINCASVGCPSLQNFAFTPEKLEKQLESSTIDFVKNNHRYSYSKKKHELEVSKIFNWYKDDFKRQYGSVQKFFALYLQNKNLESANIDYKHYSWDLNQ